MSNLSFSLRFTPLVTEGGKVFKKVTMANDQVQHIMAYMRLKAIFERLEGEIRANDYGAQFKTTQELKKKVQRLQSTLPKPI